MELLAIRNLKALVRGVQWPEGVGIEMRPKPYGDHRDIPYPEGCEKPVALVVQFYRHAKFDQRIKNPRDYVLKKYRGAITGEQLDCALAYHAAHSDLFELDRRTYLGRPDLDVLLNLLEQAGLA